VVHGLATQGVCALREQLLSLGPSVLRAKGLLREAGASGGWRLVQMVGNRVEITPAQPGDVRGHESALVLLSVDPLPDASALAARLGLVPDTVDD
jgi:G3E family GTPase